MQKLLIITLIACGSSVVGANTITSKSCAFADVSAAITSAIDGDTVLLPACSTGASWSSTLKLSKSVALIGTGAASTKIVNAGANPLIDIALPSDAPVRISGVYFDNVSNTGSDKYAIRVSGRKDGSFGLTQIRIDSNTFNKGKRTVYFTGWAYGVVDNNTFINCDIAVAPQGDGNNAWLRPITAGGANALFIEDNTFLINNNVGSEPNEQIYHQDGARSVIRNNTFDGRTYTSGSSLFFDSHGNQNYYRGTSGDFRGQPLIEVYGNNFHAYKTYRFLYLRGGSVIAYNNTMTTVVGSASALQVTEEESWQSAFFSPLKTAWAAEDQINNSFFWNNTLNGASVNDVTRGFSSDTLFIQKERDYFMHAPLASGPRTTYISRPGGTQSLVASGANAYYPYTAYAYPHPLRNADAARLTAPRNLRSVNATN